MMHNRPEVLATLGMQFYFQRGDLTPAEAITQAAKFIDAAEQSETAKDPGRLSAAVHASGRRLEVGVRTARHPDIDNNKPYDVITLGWDLTLYLDRAQTIHLRDQLNRLISGEVKED